jgi:pimeloyl-ACP methyl ester carboxylesterase
MPRSLVATGMELEYDTFGSSGDPALLLIMGFTAQMTAWPDDFCKQLADTGLFVIRFDNRDCGLSTKLDGVQVDVASVMGAAMSGQPVVGAPYTLSDMASDAVGLLDQLGIQRAHVLGASMGGMIAQQYAIDHPTRLHSLISVMSMTGEPEHGQAAPEVMAVLLAPPPADREAYLGSAQEWMVWHSKKYGDVELVRQDAAAAYDRSFYPEGASRQLAAIFATGPRNVGLSTIDVPTLVIHGRDDTLITPGGGLRTAELIEGANLLLVADMGHDMPEQLWPLLIDAISSHARRATA